MKKQIKRLTLSKETLRNLSERDMQDAVGGAVTVVACSNPCITDDTNCSESCPSFRC